MMDIRKHDDQFLNCIRKMKADGVNNDRDMAKYLGLPTPRFREIRRVCLLRERARKGVSA